MAEDSWLRQAACDSSQLGMFFSADVNDIHQAKQICFACPVQRECLLDALTWPADMDEYGIRGGLTPDERRDLPRERLRDLSPARPPHGTPYSYRWELDNLGDACDVCTEAEAESAARILEAAKIEAGDGDPRHGTPRGYRLGCRCRQAYGEPGCFDAERAYRAGQIGVTDLDSGVA